MRFGMRRVVFAILAFLVEFGAVAEAEAPLSAQQAQLDQLHLYVDQASAQLRLLNAQLKEAQERNRRQTQRITRLEHALSEKRASGAGWQQRWRLGFFAMLKRQLPVSPVYRIEADRMVIATDPVFIFSRGEIGAEGRDRLAAVAPALLRAAEQLPVNSGWRLQVEGHTDKRALRNNSRFASNWELSAARALALLRLWQQQGFPAQRLGALALGDTRPAVVGETKSVYRQNRRIEVRLTFNPVSD